MSGGTICQRNGRNARVEQEHLFAATAVSAAFFCAGEIEELACHTFFGGKDDAVFGEDAEDGASVRDGFHCILDCEDDDRAPALLMGDMRRTYSDIGDLFEKSEHVVGYEGDRGRTLWGEYGRSACR